MARVSTLVAPIELEDLNRGHVHLDALEGHGSEGALVLHGELPVAGAGKLDLETALGELGAKLSMNAPTGFEAASAHHDLGVRALRA